MRMRSSAAATSAAVWWPRLTSRAYELEIASRARASAAASGRTLTTVASPMLPFSCARLTPMRPAPTIPTRGARSAAIARLARLDLLAGAPAAADGPREIAALDRVGAHALRHHRVRR